MTGVNDPAGWYIWLTELSIIPPEYRYVLRMISWFFITLALVPIVPVVCLFIYDVTLWLFRLLSAYSRERTQSMLEKPGTDVAAPSDKSSTSQPRRKGGLRKVVTK